MTRHHVSVQGVTDALLVARLAAGDDQALSEIFDRLAPMVYAVARRVLGEGTAAQDIVQDVFVELWSQPGRYDPAAGALRTYLTVVARNRAVDLLRSELRRVARQERHYRLTPEQGRPSPSDVVLTAEAGGLVQDAVRLLPSDQRRVVELAYFQGLTCREVALAAGIPEGTAKSRLRLALAKLETLLDPSCWSSHDRPSRRPGNAASRLAGTSAGGFLAGPGGRPGHPRGR